MVFMLLAIYNSHNNNYLVDVMNSQSTNVADAKARFKLEFARRFNQFLTAAGAPRTGKGRIEFVVNMFHEAPTTSQKWLTGSTIPEPHKWPFIAEQLGRSLDDFLGKSSGVRSSPAKITMKLNNVVKLPQSGDATVWLEKNFASQYGVTQNNADLIQVSGDAMSPVLNDGDYVIIDNSVTEIDDNAIYVLKHGKSTLIRRIQVMVRSNTLALMCENNRYAKEELNQSEITFSGLSSPEGLQLIGKVVARINKM